MNSIESLNYQLCKIIKNRGASRTPPESTSVTEAATKFGSPNFGVQILRLTLYPTLTESL